MSRILLAWEQGKGLGHLYSLAGLARTLALQGHTVTLVSRAEPCWQERLFIC